MQPKPRLRGFQFDTLRPYSSIPTRVDCSEWIIGLPRLKICLSLRYSGRELLPPLLGRDRQQLFALACRSSLNLVEQARNDGYFFSFAVQLHTQRPEHTSHPVQQQLTHWSTNAVVAQKLRATGSIRYAWPCTRCGASPTKATAASLPSAGRAILLVAGMIAIRVVRLWYLCPQRERRRNKLALGVLCLVAGESDYRSRSQMLRILDPVLFFVPPPVNNQSPASSHRPRLIGRECEEKHTAHSPGLGCFAMSGRGERAGQRVVQSGAAAQGWGADMFELAPVLQCRRKNTKSIAGVKNACGAFAWLCEVSYLNEITRQKK